MKNRKVKQGKWIIVHPLDCMTLLPVFECSHCKGLCSGYEPELVCSLCGSKNLLDETRYIERNIMDAWEEFVK